MSATVDSVRLVRPDGSHIKWTTRVTLEDGQQVTFMEKLPKGAAIRQAEEYEWMAGMR